MRVLSTWRCNQARPEHWPLGLGLSIQLLYRTLEPKLWVPASVLVCTVGACWFKTLELTLWVPASALVCAVEALCSKLCCCCSAPNPACTVWVTIGASALEACMTAGRWRMVGLKLGDQRGVAVSGCALHVKELPSVGAPCM